jgi:hypothetical protein
VAIVVALRFGAASPAEPSVAEAPPAAMAAPPLPSPEPRSPEAREVQPARTVIERVSPPPVERAGELDSAAARAVLATAAGAAAGCKQAGDPTGSAEVSVTFAPSGRVAAVRVTGAPFQGTRIGGCIAATLRTATVPPFSGDPVVITRDVIVR